MTNICIMKWSGGGSHNSTEKSREDSEIVKLVSVRLWDVPCQNNQNPVVCNTQSAMVTARRKKELSIQGNVVPTDGSTPTD